VTDTGGYGEGERVFGPPQGTYDADWVASSARSTDPGLPPELAGALAARAWEHLRARPGLDAPALARQLMAREGVGATSAAVVARAALDFCRAYDVRPGDPPA